MVDDQEDFNRWWKDGLVQTGDMLTWLKRQTPEEWHLATVATSHDGDHETLEWVTAQPDCELSTALTIFWMGAPSDSIRNVYIPERTKQEGFDPRSGYVRRFELLRAIVGRLNAGFYTRRQIAFPPPETPGFTPEDLIVHRRMHKQAMDELMALGFPPPWSLPGWAANPFGGRRAQSEYDIDEGAVVHIRYDLWRARNGLTG
ncbi:DUF4274 domain-containing protein [Oricola sp.]|uniref:DUF4274 domain-containing protein n=1 Tax=Oricola sp. TaxID=1979950 RepID=UPI0025ECE3FF|nr:DUF4274 domain-containing protein [Oricola sp.]MCI5074281.1 DUF4274 domain-containing protein [Oricola sp.]